MKKINILKPLFLTLVLVASIAVANSATLTTITSVNVTYSEAFYPLQQGGIMVPQAIIGGAVSFTGQAPVYVTVQIGGQIYTQPTDGLGNFSFFVYTNGASQYTVQAWAPASTPDASSAVVKSLAVKLPMTR